jgi:hypothetical protein
MTVASRRIAIRSVLGVSGDASGWLLHQLGALLCVRS